MKIFRNIAIVLVLVGMNSCVYAVAPSSRRNEIILKRFVNHIRAAQRHAQGGSSARMNDSFNLAGKEMRDLSGQFQAAGMENVLADLRKVLEDGYIDKTVPADQTEDKWNHYLDNVQKVLTPGFRAQPFVPAVVAPVPPAPAPIPSVVQQAVVPQQLQAVQAVIQESEEEIKQREEAARKAQENRIQQEQEARQARKKVEIQRKVLKKTEDREEQLEGDRQQQEQEARAANIAVFAAQHLLKQKERELEEARKKEEEARQNAQRENEEAGQAADKEEEAEKVRVKEERKLEELAKNAEEENDQADKAKDKEERLEDAASQARKNPLPFLAGIQALKKEGREPEVKEIEKPKRVGAPPPPPPPPAKFEGQRPAAPTDLLAAIRAGKELKKVGGKTQVEEKKPAEPMSLFEEMKKRRPLRKVSELPKEEEKKPAVSTDLLQQLKAGVQLRKVSELPVEKKKEPESGIGGALRAGFGRMSPQLEAQIEEQEEEKEPEEETKPETREEVKPEEEGVLRTDREARIQELTTQINELDPEWDEDEIDELTKEKKLREEMSDEEYEEEQQLRERYSEYRRRNFEDKQRDELEVVIDLDRVINEKIAESKRSKPIITILDDLKERKERLEKVVKNLEERERERKKRDGKRVETPVQPGPAPNVLLLEALQKRRRGLKAREPKVEAKMQEIQESYGRYQTAEYVSRADELQRIREIRDEISSLDEDERTDEINSIDKRLRERANELEGMNDEDYQRAKTKEEGIDIRKRREQLGRIFQPREIKNGG